MIDRALFLTLFTTAVVMGAAPAFAETVGGQEEWCQIDDPASWAKARQDLIDGGATELPSIPCPDKATGRTIPPVLTLPMPCGRAMLFQRIDVPASHPLDQVDGNFGRAVDVSAETPQTVLSNGAWAAPVTGAFSIAGDVNNATSDNLENLTARAYYMARYELTAVQWQIFAAGLFDLPASETATAEVPACVAFDSFLGDLNLRLIPAQGNLSWFEAVDFSRAYSRWLIARDRARLDAGDVPDLPWEQGATGYVRLPTEAEWEFAARGGPSQVTAQSRSNRLPVVLQEDGETVRKADLAEVCADKPKRQGVLLGAVGRKAPNALGLYDVVCNAEEIVLDLFRPTRPDGLSGQVGGVTTKGGTSALFRERNTVGSRVEAAALFNLNGEGATATMGVRLAVSAPVFSGRRDGEASNLSTYVEGRLNDPFESSLMKGRDALLEDGVGFADAKQGEELAAEVNKLRRSLSEGKFTEQQLSEQAERLQIELDRLNTRLGEEAKSATLLTIRTGVVTANLIDRMGRNVFAAMSTIRELEELGNLTQADKDRLTRYSEIIEINENRIQASFDLYLQVHAELGNRPASFVNQQLASSRRGVGGMSVTVFGSYLNQFEKHHRAVRSARGRLTEELRAQWLSELDTTRERRRREFPKLQP